MRTKYKALVTMQPEFVFRSGGVPGDCIFKASKIKKQLRLQCNWSANWARGKSCRVLLEDISLSGIMRRGKDAMGVENFGDS
jgi:hypothetical protein